MSTSEGCCTCTFITQGCRRSWCQHHCSPISPGTDLMLRASLLSESCPSQQQLCGVLVQAVPSCPSAPCTAHHHRSEPGRARWQCDHALLFQLASWTPWPRWGWQPTVTASATSSGSSTRRLSTGGRYVVGTRGSPHLLLLRAVMAGSAHGCDPATQTAPGALGCPKPLYFNLGCCCSCGVPQRLAAGP